MLQQTSVEPEKLGRILLFSYAFPPMQTQVAPVVIKPMAALARLGYDIDVLCTEPFSLLSLYLGQDKSLDDYVTVHFQTITRLSPPDDMLGKMWMRYKRLRTIPDMMGFMHRKALRTLLDMNLEPYDCIITWSPFHSINPVMVDLKRQRPNVRWIAQFSDPWADNPLERRRIVKYWNAKREPLAVNAADHIIHNSSYTHQMMIRKYGTAYEKKATVIPHPYDKNLFPKRAKAQNQCVTIRYVGTLFERRSPENLFRALGKLLQRRPDLRNQICVELVGYTEPGMLKSPAAIALPDGMVIHTPSLSYMQSLEKMYDADILVLIEADVKKNLFVPSKFSDYMGAATPIICLTSPEGSGEIMAKLDCWCAAPAQVDDIALAVEQAVDYTKGARTEPWCNEGFRARYDADQIAEKFQHIFGHASQ